MRKLLSIVLAVAVCISLAMPAAFAAGAGETVVTTAEELQAAFNQGGNVTLGGDIGAQSTLTVKASTSLDLNGHKLTVITSRKSALVIDVGQTFTISDSQYDTFVPGNGKLLANGYRAGIQTSGGTLIVNSGVVEATGQWATGIGGIDEIGYNDGGTVTINGGIVTATGGCPGTFGGAGIGGMSSTGSSGGRNGGTITINGGTVTATGGKYSAGIGSGGCAGGFYRDGDAAGTITIRGGSVKASAGNYGTSDIGCGAMSSRLGSLEVMGGTVELTGKGVDVGTLSLKNCTITGNGAGENKGSYDSSGNRIVVIGASAWASENVASAMAANLVPMGLQSNYTQATTRAEFCALAVALYETVTGQEITQRKTFADTSDVNVEKMGALDVVSGVGTDQFNPNGSVTREQAATMLARLAQAVGEPLPEANVTFSDKASISSWAAKQVGQVQAVGIMGGVGNNRFDPSGSYTREQSMITMLRLFHAVK